jgi:hypothetical protein
MMNSRLVRTYENVQQVIIRMRDCSSNQLNSCSFDQEHSVMITNAEHGRYPTVSMKTTRATLEYIRIYH